MKKIFYLLVLSLAFWSCEQDDPAAVLPQTTNPQIMVTPMVDVSGTFVANSHIINSGSGQAKFNLDREYSPTDFFAIEYEGNDYVVQGGDTQSDPFEAAAFLFELPESASGSEGLMGLSGQTVTDVPVTPFTSVTKDDYMVSWIENRPSDLLVFQNDMPLAAISEASINNVTVYDRLPEIDSGMLTFVMDWEGPYAGNDFDIKLLDAGSNTIMNGYSVNRFEEVELDNSLPDGIYYLNVGVWTGSGMVPSKVFVGFPNGAIKMYDFIVDADNTGWPPDVTVLQIEKNGSDYSVTML